MVVSSSFECRKKRDAIEVIVFGFAFEVIRGLRRQCGVSDSSKVDPTSCS